MKLEFDQTFHIPHHLPLERAVAFLRDPARSLGGVSFMRNLRVAGDLVSAELLVQVPLLGELPLPFESTLEPTEGGATLHPRSLSGKAWSKVGGVGQAQGGELVYRLRVEVFVELPGGEKWGGFAFRKMVDATSKKALEGVVREFPLGVARGLTQLEGAEV